MKYIFNQQTECPDNDDWIKLPVRGHQSGRKYWLRTALAVLTNKCTDARAAMLAYFVKSSPEKLSRDFGGMPLKAAKRLNELARDQDKYGCEPARDRLERVATAMMAVAELADDFPGTEDLRSCAQGILHEYCDAWYAIENARDTAEGGWCRQADEHWAGLDNAGAAADVASQLRCLWRNHGDIILHDRKGEDRVVYGAFRKAGIPITTELLMGSGVQA